MILSTALPLSASRIAGSLLSTVENLLIPRQLQLHGQNTVQALSTYGELTGMAMPLVLLPSACLMAASVSLVPEISEAWRRQAGYPHQQNRFRHLPFYLCHRVRGGGAVCRFSTRNLLYRL